MNLFLNVVMLSIVISIFFLSLINKEYKISRAFGIWLIKLLNLGAFSKFIDTAGNYSINKNKTKNIVLGILIGVPIAIVLLRLLRSADRYFNELILSIGDIFLSIFNVDVIIQNFSIFGIFFISCFVILINVIRHRSTKDKEPILYNINRDIIKTILFIVNAVFILFLISEISKIAGNFLSLPIEYTYAEYAREGFFQLLFVTVINFSIIAYCLYFAKDLLTNKTVKSLLTVLVCFSILLIFNSYYRMFLYINTFEFTILRLQVVLFLLMELILFILILRKIFNKLKTLDAILFTTVIVSTYIINVYLCSQPFVDFLNNSLF
ncbi:MAG: DUF4173 domain-containing protein [Oscillospiraceae bacterium]|nr:DUF4173 domain-containing protein [Oscillospiraceae bacterium]